MHYCNKTMSAQVSKHVHELHASLIIFFVFDSVYKAKAQATVASSYKRKKLNKKSYKV